MNIDKKKIHKKSQNTGVDPYTLIKRKLEFRKTNDPNKNCGECQLRRECSYDPENIERDHYQYECEQCGQEYGTEHEKCPFCEWPVGRVMRCELIGVVIKPHARVTKYSVCDSFSELKPEIKPDDEDQPELKLTGGQI